MNKNITGVITQIHGPIIDVKFSEETLPDIYECLKLEAAGSDDLILEVLLLIGHGTARCIAMGSTDGLKRGMKVLRTHASITVPVGPEILGRMVNALGQPIDGKGSIETTLRYPIHRKGPGFVEQSTRVEIFETGIKVIDLIAPFTKGGKTGIFGGAGVGKTVIIQELIRTIPKPHVARKFFPGEGNLNP